MTGLLGRGGVRGYAYATGLAGAVAAATTALLAPKGDVDPVVTGALTVVAILGAAVPLRLHRKSGVRAFTLEEGIFLAMLFVVPLQWLPLLVGVAGAVGQLAVSRDRMKLSFNVGQVFLWAAAGAWTFRAVGTGDTILSMRSITAVVAATLALNVTNYLLIAELFRRTEGRSYVETLSDLWRLNSVTAVGNISFGLVVAIVAGYDPLGILLAGVLMSGLYLGYRGYAGVLEERGRAERLHQTTRALVDATAEGSALAVFVQRLGGLFGGETAELVLIGDGSGRRLVLEDGSVHELPADGRRTDAIAEALRSRTPVRLSSSGEIHRDGIAAPLIHDERLIGAIAVRDRRGLEPWNDTDLTLLSSLANEAAVALKNVELFAAVEGERARLAEESQKLSDVVDAASDGIVMIDADGRLGTWNQAIVNITGVPTGEAIGQPWFVVLRLREPDGSDVLPDGEGVFQRGLRGQRLDTAVELQVLRRDGQWRWIRCTVAPVDHHDEPAGVVVVARDVTTERETEELKTDFVATVSHELRTPLTPIRGGFELLRTRRDQLDDSQRDAIETSIERQLDRLETLVGDLLTVADIDRDAVPLSREPVDVSGTVLQAVLVEAPEGLRERVDVDLADAPRAIGDRAAVERIVRALLSNALQHTEGQVRVTAVRRGDVVDVAVSDDGPGLSARDQERIFQRFGRLGDHLHRNQGPGLGLPIARALARRLDGDVTVRSELGRGSTFTVELPSAGPRPTRLSDAV